MSAPFTEKLLQWYDAHRTDLPWRRDPSPYHVWLAEIMLQQTQVETVIPYYERFLAAFPTIADLAAADLGQVLKLWEGLGYYGRARNLQRTAQILIAEHGGRLPGDADELMKLPGIGRYTAGAVSSIAFGRSAPVVDGNLIRIFARLQDLEDDVSEGKVRDRLWDLAAAWVPAERAGDYNQALMELGQRICRPKNPVCADCPISAHCRAFQNGTQAQRPVRRKRAAIPHYDVCAGLVRDKQGRLLIAQRPLQGLLGGLWEFPGGKREADESFAECLRRELREELAIDVEVGELFTVVDHAFTHFKITLRAYDCRYLGALPPYDQPQALEALDWEWVTERELEDYSFGKADRQVIAALCERRDMLL